MNLSSKHVLVTGGSRGIGESIAREFARRGASVSIAARDLDSLEKVAADIGGTAHQVDLNDAGQAASLIDSVEAAAGPVDVLVNNAGIDAVGEFVTKSLDDIEKLIRVNVTSPMVLARQVIPRMSERGDGHVVNVSSVAAHAAFAGMSLYAASKAALTHFSDVLFIELADTPVGLTLVEVGPVPSDMLSGIAETPQVQAGFDRAYRLQLAADVPAASLAAGIADAVAAGRRHVRLPARMAMFSLVGSLPQRITDLVGTGLPRRA